MPANSSSKPDSIEAYITAAAPAARPHLRRLHALLRELAPQAQEAIKWSTPFFIEPRFLFAFSAHKAHLDFAPGEATLNAFREELAGFRTTKNFLQVRYDEALPEDLIRRLALHQMQAVRQRSSDSFW